MSEHHFFSELASPVGKLLLVSDGDALIGLHFEGRERPQPGWKRDDRVLKAAREQLEAYFEGDLTAFDLPLAAEGTVFQKKVWKALCRIPFAATASYADVARKIGQPTAMRGVGAANGRNPIAIIVPCHRVIGANGTLVGFGGGLNRKTWLLRHEAEVAERGGLACSPFLLAALERATVE